MHVAINGHANHIAQCENHGCGKFLTEDGFRDEETLVFHCDVEREQSTSRVQHANNMLLSPKTHVRQPPLPWLPRHHPCPQVWLLHLCCNFLRLGV